MEIINKIRTKFRKHNFDLENPELIVLEVGGKQSVKFNRYKCTNCGTTLSLDLWQMKDLPFSMARGCKGKVIIGKGS